MSHPSEPDFAEAAMVAVFGAPFCGAEGVPSGEARAVERADAWWAARSARSGKEEAEEGYSGQNHGAGAFRTWAFSLSAAPGRFLLCRKMARQDGVPRILFAAQKWRLPPRRCHTGSSLATRGTDHHRRRFRDHGMRGPHARPIRSSGSLSGNTRKLS